MPQLTPKQKVHQKYLRSLYVENLWESFRKIMDIDHKKNLHSCITLEEKENYLNGIDSLFRQYAASYNIPRKVVKKSNVYNTLSKLTKYNVYSDKHNSTISRNINQLEMCAIRKTTSKRSFNKNKLILKRELTCVQKAYKLENIKSEWKWLDTKYHKDLETNSINTSNKWVPAEKWSLDSSS